MLRGPADIWWLEDDKKVTAWIHQSLNWKKALNTRTPTVKLEDVWITWSKQQQFKHTSINSIRFTWSYRILLKTNFLDRLTRSLNPAVQTHVLNQDPFWLSQAEHQALVFENAHSVQVGNNLQPMSSYHGPQPMDLDVIRQQQRSEPIRCYNCGGIGHLQRVCPSNLGQ